MKVWVYCGQHDLVIDIKIFADTELGEIAAVCYAKQQKEFFGKRLVYTLDKVEVWENEGS